MEKAATRRFILKCLSNNNEYVEDIHAVVQFTPESLDIIKLQKNHLEYAAEVVFNLSKYVIGAKVADFYDEETIEFGQFSFEEKELYASYGVMELAPHFVLPGKALETYRDEVWVHSKYVAWSATFVSDRKVVWTEELAYTRIL